MTTGDISLKLPFILFNAKCSGYVKKEDATQKILDKMSLGDLTALLERECSNGCSSANMWSWTDGCEKIARTARPRLKGLSIDELYAFYLKHGAVLSDLWIEAEIEKRDLSAGELESLSKLGCRYGLPTKQMIDKGCSAESVLRTVAKPWGDLSVEIAAMSDMTENGFIFLIEGQFKNVESTSWACVSYPEELSRLESIVAYAEKFIKNSSGMHLKLQRALSKTKLILSEDRLEAGRRRKKERDCQKTKRDKVEKIPFFGKLNRKQIRFLQEQKDFYCEYLEFTQEQKYIEGVWKREGESSYYKDKVAREKKNPMYEKFMEKYKAGYESKLFSYSDEMRAFLHELSLEQLFEAYKYADIIVGWAGEYLENCIEHHVKATFSEDALVKLFWLIAGKDHHFDFGLCEAILEAMKTIGKNEEVAEEKAMM